MKKTYLALLVLVLTIIAFAGYVLLFEKSTNNPVNINTAVQDNVSYPLTSEVINLLRNRNLGNLFVFEGSSDNTQPKQYTLKRLETNEQVASFTQLPMTWFGEPYLRNGFTLEKKEVNGNIHVELYDVKESLLYPLFTIQLKQDESVNGLKFSLDSKAIYISLVQQYSPTNYVNGYSDEILQSRIFKFDINSAKLEKVFEEKGDYKAVAVLEGTEGYTIIQKYLTEANGSNLYKYDLKTKEETDLSMQQYRYHLVSPDQSKIIFISSEDLGGTFQVKDLKLFDVQKEEFDIISDYANTVLQTSEFGTWPDRSEMIDVKWLSDSNGLLFLKWIFSNGDINNAKVDILSLDMEKNLITKEASFRTEEISANQLLGMINNEIYVNGTVNGSAQTRVYPGNTILFNEETPAALIY